MSKKQERIYTARDLAQIYMLPYHRVIRDLDAGRLKGKKGTRKSGWCIKESDARIYLKNIREQHQKIIDQCVIKS